MARSRRAPTGPRGPEPPPVDEFAQSLPHDLTAERSVLGAIILDNAAYARVESLRSEHFYRRAHSCIYAALSRLLDVSKGVADFVTLRAELHRTGELDDVGGQVYIADLVNGMPRATNIAHYAGIVIDHARRRDLISESNKLIAQAYEAEASVDDLLADADMAMMRLRHGKDDGKMLSLAVSQRTLISDLEYRFHHRGELMGVPTGFASIDAYIGGWTPGDMNIVAARPSIGKTTMVMQSACAAAESRRRDGTPRRVAVFSMEMKRIQLEYRLLSMLSGVPVTLLQGGWVPDHAAPQWQAIADAQERMAAMAMYVDDSSAQTVSQIRGKCRRLLAEEGGLDLVAIDYVQLMPGEVQRKGATRNDEVTDISRRLKVMAGDINCPVLVLSQLNRAGASRFDPTPKMSDLRESGALEQDADMVTFLHRKNHKESGPTQFIIEKARNGPTGSLWLTIERDTTRFQDGATPPTQEQEDAEQAEQKKLFARRGAVKKNVRI
ncbi:MAG: replicative DNA helicase [Thermoplasmatota archaeon]